MIRLALALLFLLLTTAATGGCASSGAAAPTLYSQLGGEPGLDRIVDRFLRELAGNERISHHFRKTDIKRFRRLLTEQLCEISDGPCVYSGDSMLEVHRGMKVTEGDFNGLVEDLIDAMDAEQIPLGVQNQLLARLAPMQPDIVETRRERTGR